MDRFATLCVHNGRGPDGRPTGACPTSTWYLHSRCHVGVLVVVEAAALPLLHITLDPPPGAAQIVVCALAGINRDT